MISTVDTLLTLGETQSALAVAKQAQEIFESLLKQNRDSTDLQRELSVSYGRVGDVQMAQGNLPAALTSYQASLAIRDRLAKSDPGMPAGSAISRCHTTKSATCRWRRAIFRPR